MLFCVFRSITGSIIRLASRISNSNVIHLCYLAYFHLSSRSLRPTSILLSSLSPVCDASSLRQLLWTPRMVTLCALMSRCWSVYNSVSGGSSTYFRLYSLWSTGICKAALYIGSFTCASLSLLYMICGYLARTDTYPLISVSFRHSGQHCALSDLLRTFFSSLILLSLYLCRSRSVPVSLTLCKSSACTGSAVYLKVLLALLQVIMCAVFAA